MDSQDAKIRVFIPDKYRYEGFTELENLIERHVDVVNMQQLYENPKLAQGLQVAFSVERRIAVILDLLHNSMLPDLKLICNHGAGVNHIPIADLNNLGIKVTNTPDVLSDGTADMGMALMLASARQLLLGTDLAMKTPHDFSKTILSQEVSHSTIGIVGMGSIGYKVAERARGFSMKILYNNRSRRSAEDENAVGATYFADLMEMLPLCDFVMVTCPLTPDTKNLFTSAQFDVMKSSAHLINIARGPIVNTCDLVSALTNGKIRSAALDVTDPEPLTEGHPLLTLPNVIIVPHWGSATVGTRTKLIQLMIDNAKAFYSGQPLLTEVKLKENPIYHKPA